MEERRYGPQATTLDEIDRGPYVGNYREIDLVAHIRELLSENAALKADAARYNWLKDHVCGGSLSLKYDILGPNTSAWDEEIDDEIEQG